MSTAPREPWYKRLAAKRKAQGRLKVLNSRDPPDECYLIRYEVAKCCLGAIYLHEIRRSDDVPDYHDHPWPFFHVILEGQYVEEVPGDVRNSGVRRPGYWAFHMPWYQHRLELFAERLPGVGLSPCTVWSLVIIGPKVRQWGFIDRVTGCWTEWRKYIAGERC